MTGETKMPGTRTFIGSSSEGLDIANAVKTNLADCTECQVWTEGVFLPGRVFIEALESILDKVDYAILVATPDDVLTQREVEALSMRDNVLLELGLFMAKLGRSRTYLVAPADQPVRIPTDLLGIKLVNYASATTPEKAVAALAEPCKGIRQAMREAEKELSLSMKRTVVRRLLVLTNRIQSFVVSLQTETVRSILDRAHFERLRADSAGRVAALTREYEEDAEKLGVLAEAQRLTNALLEAIRTLPFPEEAVIRDEDVVGGLLSHLTGRRSVDDQVRDRLARLTGRYEEWWARSGPQVAKTLNDFQASLIAAL